MIFSRVGLALFLPGMLVLIGCGTPPAPPALPAKDAMPDKTADAVEKAEPKSPEELAKEEKLKKIYDRHISKLPEAEAALARQQRICPVMEKPLGSMGTPIKVDVQGRAVYICCEGCREELLAKPEESLARIPKP